MLFQYFYRKCLFKSAVQSTRTQSYSWTVRRPSAPGMQLFVIGAGGPCGSPKSLLIVGSPENYLINCGQGIQRALVEKRGLDAKLKNIFLTKLSLENTSGIQGISLGLAALTKSDSKKEIVVHGPGEASKFSNYISRFSDSTNCTWSNWDYSTRPYEDSQFVIRAFSLSTPKVASEADEPPEKVPRHEDNDTSTCYAFLFKLKPKGGKLNTELLNTIDIPREIRHSRSMQDLKLGKDLHLPDGRVIRAQDYVATEHLRSVLILECDSPEACDSFANHEELLSALKNEKSNEYLDIVVHFVPEDVMQNAAFRRLLDKLDSVSASSFRPHPLRHLVVDGSTSLPMLRGILEMQATLNTHIDPLCFPLLWHQKCDTTSHHTDKFPRIWQHHPHVYLADPGLGYDVVLTNDFITDGCTIEKNDQLADSSFNEIYIDRQTYDEQTRKAKEELAAIRAELPKERIFPEVVFLGTSSSCPSRYRNVSGILVHLSEDSCVLVDCGESTLMQLLYLYGPEECDRVLRNLKLVLITHMHADHHLGLIPLLHERIRALKSVQQTEWKMLAIMGPGVLFQHIRTFVSTFFTSIVDLEQYFVLLPLTWDFCDREGDLHPDVVRDRSWYVRFLQVQRLLGIHVLPVRVYHTGNSYGYVLSGLDWPKEGSEIDSWETLGGNSPLWKIVFSGDCRPSEALAKCGADCDLLIHEATFSDAFIEQAVKKKHSAVGEVLEVSRNMRAKFTVLTHFSARIYQSLPIQEMIPQVACSFDFLRTNFHELPLLARSTPYYKVLFSKSQAKLELSEIKVRARY